MSKVSQGMIAEKISGTIKWLWENVFFESDVDIALPQVLVGRCSPNIAGLFATETWQDDEGKKHDEIMVNANLLSPIYRKPEQFYATLIHELVHFWHKFYHGKEEPSHNERWRDKARRMGLIITDLGDNQCDTVIDKTSYTWQKILQMPRELWLDLESTEMYSPGQAVPVGVDVTIVVGEPKDGEGLPPAGKPGVDIPPIEAKVPRSRKRSKDKKQDALFALKCMRCGRSLYIPKDNEFEDYDIWCMECDQQMVRIKL